MIRYVALQVCKAAASSAKAKQAPGCFANNIGVSAFKSFLASSHTNAGRCYSKLARDGVVNEWKACNGGQSARTSARALASSVLRGSGCNVAQRGLSTKALHGLSETATQKVYQGIAAGLTASQRNQIALWLGVSSAWVFSLVILGGVTRLTRSGLSMTDWKFTGESPPACAEDWEVEFSKYRSSPEFQKLNSRMTLDEFKFIYWMEYAHRMWGRSLGLLFAVPAAYFAASGMINRALAARLALLFTMGGTQGLVGWWMVRSGLQTPKNEYDVPRVSPYRLAAHLTSAFAIYATLVWTTLSMAYPLSPTACASALEQGGSALLRSRILPLSVLIGITAVSGAFVAGLDAGHAYNTFPLMNGQIIPDEYFTVDGWSNAFESTAAVQLHHRLLALTTLTSTAATWWWARSLPLPVTSRKLTHILLAVVGGQVALGVTTLMLYVPVSLGSAHQANAMVIFTVCLGLLHTLRPQVQMAPGVIGLVTPAAMAGVLGIGYFAVNNT